MAKDHEWAQEKEREREYGLMIIKVENINMQYLLMNAHCTHNVYVWFIILSCGFLHRKKTFVIYAPKAQIHTDAKEENRVSEREREKVRTNGFWFSIESDNTFSFFERAKVTINDINAHTMWRAWQTTKINYTKYITHGPIICINFGYTWFPKRIQTP